MVSLSNHEVVAQPALPPSIVTLGPDPRALHLPTVEKVQCPRVKPEGDARWVME